ncbi:MAG TPA: hypothetical protein VN642_10325 [Dongiaceae bacterium]|nr:hypothetical protein [Dongiaceae bacterium]
MAYTVKGLINTSLDDCRISLQLINNMTLLMDLLTECIKTGQVSRAQVVQRRINKLQAATDPITPWPFCGKNNT